MHNLDTTKLLFQMQNAAIDLCRQRDFFEDSFNKCHEKLVESEVENARLKQEASSAYSDGVRDCIKCLRELGGRYMHESEWHFSRQSKFAPVELSDYLVRKVLRRV